MDQIKLNPIIKNLIPGLAERGKIKIGRKGEAKVSSKGNEYRLPEKLDHFLITTLERDENDDFVLNKAIHKEIGIKPKSVKIRLLYDSIGLDFQCRYSCYFGKNLWCTGDGENGLRALKNTHKRKPVICPCERIEPGYNGDKNDGKGICKINGTLSALIETKSASIGGVWKFRTTGRNSTMAILGSLNLISSITGGLLAGIPLNMTIMPKISTNPKTNDPVTIYVVGIEFDGNVEQLRQFSLGMAQGEAVHRLRLKDVEYEAKRMIEYDVSLKEERADIVEEYHPEETKKDPVIPDKPKDIAPEKPKTEKPPVKKETVTPEKEAPKFADKFHSPEPNATHQEETEQDDIDDIDMF
jgi:hypothetical protein